MVRLWNRSPKEMVHALVFGYIQDQAGSGSEQPDLVVDVPDHCNSVGLGYLYGLFPTHDTVKYCKQVL